MDRTEFTSQYVETALWSSGDGEHEFLDCFDISDSAMEMLVEVANKFFDENRRDILAFCEEHSCDVGTAGHLFWLNSNGHGSGFFDYHSDVAVKLEKQARSSRGFDLYVGDDDLVYVC